jgi:hypothetical protein
VGINNNHQKQRKSERSAGAQQKAAEKMERRFAVKRLKLKDWKTTATAEATDSATERQAINCTTAARTAGSRTKAVNCTTAD